ncbi:hypothetical protein F5Y00DRAFT_229980 [Daldinia vernicosa]|uniref:uncharacterized protein n=1 Tax=Daldinia vernicosa TaxID=114800 RepID=UPI002008702C|nr:uncharacterized protein F5Y00DRAFT_229980 [Daldinia vernicosa]KAI0851517.1 hypothetical protein F5Y00DRAFT_229980 [Daldinia vernicosa]
MAPPISNTSAEPTLYDILSLTPKHLAGQAGIAQQQKIVKQAYHRALLKYHPDKSASGNPPEGSRTSTPTPSASTSTSTPSKPGPKQTSQPRITYTVDQIQHAYAVLSDRKQRADYDRALRTAPSQRPSQSSSSFQTGVETVDLDDLAFDERTGVYYRPCRCGNARGYAFTEDNLEEFEDDGVLMVECLDCSLWIRVLFAAADDDDDDDDDGDGDNDDNNVVATTTSLARSASTTVRSAAVALTIGRSADAVTSAGERRGSGTGRNYTFNWSFNWGLSLSGSATAGTSTSSSSRM